MYILSSMLVLSSVMIFADMFKIIPVTNFVGSLIKYKYNKYTQPRYELINNHYKINYKINNKEFYFLVNKTNTFENIIYVTDSNDNDVTDVIVPMLGPHETAFYEGGKLTPKLLGYKTLNFELIDKEISFEENDEIIL